MLQIVPDQRHQDLWSILGCASFFRDKVEYPHPLVLCGHHLKKQKGEIWFLKSLYAECIDVLSIKCVYNRLHSFLKEWKFFTERSTKKWIRNTRHETIKQTFLFDENDTVIFTQFNFWIHVIIIFLPNFKSQSISRPIIWIAGYKRKDLKCKTQKILSNMNFNFTSNWIRKK